MHALKTLYFAGVVLDARFSVLSLFFVFTSLRARLRPALGLAGVLELAMRLSYLRVVLSFYGSRISRWNLPRN